MERGRHILDKKSSDLLISKLRAIQKKEGFLSETRLKKLSRHIKIQITKIYEVATFYSFFTVKQKGKHVIRLCNSPSCLIHGSENIQKAIEKELGIKTGETTKDKKFTLELTSCIGCCNESPSAMIDNKVYTELTEEKIINILKKCR